MRPHSTVLIALGGLVLAATMPAAQVRGALLPAPRRSPATAVEIRTLSTDASRVAGGDVLVQIVPPEGVPKHALKVSVGSRDVTALFQESQEGSSQGTLMGVVAGLVEGKNTLTVHTNGNVGIQYGLNALNRGAITKEQFLHLNETIGGVDHDSNYVRSRTAGDAGAIKRAYQSGLILGANGGLTSIPIFDDATSNETGGYHYGWFHFAVRERLRKATGGDSGNLVMWRSTHPETAQTLFDAWMSTYKADGSSDPQRRKVIRARPSVEGCYEKSTSPTFIAENLVFSAEPVSRCSALYPVYSNTRKEAGGPLAADVLKCQLKPVDSRDYQVTFTPAEFARLRMIFPGGVCDWSKPGVNQVPVITWASFGPSPRNLISVGEEK